MHGASAAFPEWQCVPETLLSLMLVSCDCMPLDAAMPDCHSMSQCTASQKLRAVLAQGQRSIAMHGASQNDSVFLRFRVLSNLKLGASVQHTHQAPCIHEHAYNLPALTYIAKFCHLA